MYILNICTVCFYVDVFEICSSCSTAPQILGWSIRRINYTAYSFVINLGSNGGASIIQVNVSCRQVGADGGWSPTLVVLTSPPGGPALTGVATSQQFTPYSGPYEFQLSVVNGAYFQSALIGGNETVGMCVCMCVCVK